MSDMEKSRGRAVVVQPGTRDSFWQPQPANGFAAPMLTPDITGFEGFSMGFQHVAPGGHIRPHSHADQIELQICFSGHGHVIAGDERHDLTPGTSCFLGPDVVHEIHNDGDQDLVQLWVIGKAGLEDFFKAIGRPRREGEPAPDRFDRPVDVKAVEKAMGFDNT